MPRGFPCRVASSRSEAPVTLSSDGTYLITGGLGALGQRDDAEVVLVVAGPRWTVAVQAFAHGSDPVEGGHPASLGGQAGGPHHEVGRQEPRPGRGRRSAIRPHGARPPLRAGVDARTPRERWIEEGLRLLADGGPDAVRVEVLAKRLGVTKGGFYGSFADRGALLDAMLDTWERESTDEVIARVAAPSAPTPTRSRRAA